MFDYTSSGYDTKRAAEFAAKQIELDYERGFIKDDDNSSFADYFEKWIKLYKLEDNKHRTNSFRMSAVRRCHELFGNTKLKNINRDYYQKIINDLGKTLDRSTVRKYHNYFKSCLEHAFDEKIIHTNPAKKTILKGDDSRVKKSSEKFLNYSDALKLKQALIDEEYNVSNLGRNCAIIALETGMRFGEILGLTRDRVDLDNNKLTIDRSYDYAISKTLIPTKTGNSRTIVISDFLVEFLKNIFTTFPENDFVIANDVETHVSNNEANYTLMSACKRAGIKRVTLHHLRHTRLYFVI